MDVFSQIPQPDVTNYEENSFCVADDEEPSYGIEKYLNFYSEFNSYYCLSIEFSDDGSLENFIEKDEISSNEDQLLSTKIRPQRNRTKHKLALREKFQTLKKSRTAREERKKYKLFSKPIYEEEEDNEEDDNDIIAKDEDNNKNCHRNNVPSENEQSYLELDISLDDFIESDSDAG